jgi:drug/metabolite transporter (DMT)-like permease
VLFGSTMLASRFSVGQFAPMTYVGIRLALASFAHVLIFVFGGEKRRWPRGRELWWRSAVLGIFGTVFPMNFITTSLQFQSSGVTSMLVTLGPAVTVIFAHFLLDDESLTARKIFGVVMALSGAVLMLALGESGLPDVGAANPVGYQLVFAAMISSSAATIFARKTMGGFEPLQVASIRMWTAAAVTVPLSLVFFGFDLCGVNTQGWLATGWAAVTGTFLAMLLSFTIIQRFGATASAMPGYVIPVVAGIGGWLLLGEELTWGIASGMALIFGGIVLINHQRRRPKEIVV